METRTEKGGGGDTSEEKRARGGGEEGERGDVAEVGARLQVVAGGHGEEEEEEEPSLELRKTLPELFSYTRHEWVEQAQADGDKRYRSTRRTRPGTI
uniref:Uncharacterized protein n=1 Tax=Oryza nivara TaxID=4536 RepID=A0A0E0GFX4_ORYNI